LGFFTIIPSFRGFRGAGAFPLGSDSIADFPRRAASGIRQPMRLKLIGCEVLYRELCLAASRSRNQVDIEFLPKGLHDLGASGMSRQLREALARVDQDRYEAILLGYGLCNNGLVGLAADRIPLVLPRAHDCITLFLGSRERYEAYFHQNPGTYFLTSGWIERGNQVGIASQLSIPHLTGMTSSYPELVAKYGEDNASFLYRELCDTTRNYRQVTLIEMGVEPDDRFERKAREEAGQRRWNFEKVAGDLRLLTLLVDGPWDAGDFLVVPAGHSIRPSYDEQIVTLEN
jgi:hypothetical protein